MRARARERESEKEREKIALISRSCISDDAEQSNEKKIKFDIRDEHRNSTGK